MLYITTRNNRDVYTAYKALHEDTAPDGGHYVPFRLPLFEQEQLVLLKEKSFGQNVADVLNIFFSTSRITGWDVELCIGRNATKLVSMNHRIMIAEMWHNPTSCFDYAINSLYKAICKNNELIKASEWFIIAVQIAVYFGIYGELCKQKIIEEGTAIDVSVPLDNYAAPIAALYARKMGLPIKTIICTCENSVAWDLIQRGAVNTVGLDCKILHWIERLLQETLGFSYVQKLLDDVKEGKQYVLHELDLNTLNTGLFCVVVGESRSDQTINSVYRSNSYILDPDTAFCIGGLQDYRAKTGCSRPTIVFSYVSPLEHIRKIETATGVSKDHLIGLISKS